MNPVTDFLNAHLARVDAQLDKFSKVAADIRQVDADELAEDEHAYWHRQELVDEARKEDREALDGRDEEPNA